MIELTGKINGHTLWDNGMNAFTITRMIDQKKNYHSV